MSTSWRNGLRLTAAALGGEFTVNTILEKDQVGPSVAMSTDGSFVVAWTSEGQVGSGADVFARRFDNEATGLGEDFRVNETTRQGQQYPAVAMDDYNSFVVTWQSSHQDGFSWGIFAKAYDASGAVLAPEFQVNANTQGPQTNPALGANTQGDAVALWLGLDATHKSAVHAQRFQLPQTEPEFVLGPEGEVVLSNFVALEEAPAAAATDADGNYVVTWQSYGQDGSGLGSLRPPLRCGGSAPGRCVPGEQYHRWQPESSRRGHGPGGQLHRHLASGLPRR